jgi:hypothetical protein
VGGGPKVWGVTLEDQRVAPLRPDVTGAPGLPEAVPHRTQVTVRTAVELRQERREAAKRQEVALRVTLVTLFWLVSVSLLVGWGLTVPDEQGSSASSTLAALLAVVLPFVAAVIATKSRQFIVGGFYVVLTLAMVLPALGIARSG